MLSEGLECSSMVELIADVWGVWGTKFSFYTPLEGGESFLVTFILGRLFPNMVLMRFQQDLNFEETIQLTKFVMGVGKTL